MSLRSMLVLALVTLAASGSLAAQDFGVMESAEMINQGNFKLKANPILSFGENGADDEIGVGLGLGYGFSRSVDGELKAALYDGVTYFGGDLELGLLQGPGANFSVSGGVHLSESDRFDTLGLDLTGLLSALVANRLEVYGALDLAFESIRNEGFRGDDSYTVANLVPGIEFAVSPNLDFLAEVGIGLNDDSRTYVSGGLAYYIR